MSSWPGTVVHRRRTSPPSRVGVFEGVCVPLLLMNCLFPVPDCPSFSSRRCTDLEQSSAAYHICSVTSCLLLSLEDIFELCYPQLLLSCPRSDTVIYGHVNLSYLLTYLLTYLQFNSYLQSNCFTTATVTVYRILQTNVADYYKHNTSIAGCRRGNVIKSFWCYMRVVER